MECGVALGPRALTGPGAAGGGHDSHTNPTHKAYTYVALMPPPPPVIAMECRFAGELWNAGLREVLELLLGQELQGGVTEKLVVVNNLYLEAVALEDEEIKQELEREYKTRTKSGIRM